MMHIEDLRKFAPLWLSKTEEVRNDREHWATNITGDIYGKGWISEMYGYSFGAAEVCFLAFLPFFSRAGIVFRVGVVLCAQGSPQSTHA